MSQNRLDGGTQQVRTRRLPRGVTPSMVLLVLLLLVLVGAVLKIRGQISGSETGTLSIADQEAVEASVAHRQVSFQGTLLDGSSWSSTQARGSVLVVNLWASWCGPCRAEQPSLNQVARAYRRRGVEFIGVNVQDSQSAAKAYVREFQVPYPSLSDPSLAVAGKLGALALPTTFILDRDGVAAYRLTGKTTVPILSARLDRLLAAGGRWAG